jgi:hypothetical protein
VDLKLRIAEGCAGETGDARVDIKLTSSLATPGKDVRVQKLMDVLDLDRPKFQEGTYTVYKYL